MTSKIIHRDAFSLVELSIVLVILGLLVGGVLSGQALIQAAQLRAVSEEYTKYTTAALTFRDKYLATPGDMKQCHRVLDRWHLPGYERRYYLCTA